MGTRFSSITAARCLRRKWKY